jgi:5-methylcytosine-specific restriction endonuclease McrA
METNSKGFGMGMGLGILNPIKPEYKKTRIPARVRHLVWNKYFNGLSVGTCICCNSMPIYLVSFECGHVQSEKNGGENTVDNLRPICRACNLSMKTTNMDDFMKKYGLNKTIIK